MRVTGGEGKGRRLKTPAGRITRPTSAKTRQAIFNILGSVEGLVVADLFAGSGAVGFEALARGAAQVTFVERAAAAVQALRENAARLGVRARTRIIQGDVFRVIPRLPLDRCDLIFVDPPYEAVDLPDLLGRLAARPLRLGARVVAQHRWTEAMFEVPAPFLPVIRRRHGETGLLVLKTPGGK